MGRRAEREPAAARRLPEAARAVDALVGQRPLVAAVRLRRCAALAAHAERPGPAPDCARFPAWVARVEPLERAAVAERPLLAVLKQEAVAVVAQQAAEALVPAPLSVEELDVVRARPAAAALPHVEVRRPGVLAQRPAGEAGRDAALQPAAVEPGAEVRRRAVEAAARHAEALLARRDAGAELPAPTATAAPHAATGVPFRRGPGSPQQSVRAPALAP